MLDMHLAALDPAMRFGHAELDAHHRHILGILDRLQALSTQDRVSDALHDAYHELMAYAFDHFNTEEAFLLHQGYPGLQAHREAHRRILLSLTDMAQDLMQPGLNAGQLAQRMHAMVLDHFQGADRECARFLQGRDPTP